MNDASAKLVAIFPALAFALVFLIEAVRPRRALRFGRLHRWTTSVLLFASNRAAVGLLAWIIAVPAVALWVEKSSIGLFNLIALPLWAEILAAFLLLDFAMWLQHLLTHKLPFLWRFHKVHHADPDIDVSTAIRFHPGEIAFSVLWKSCWVLLLGISAPVILTFEAWLAANAAFNHGNIELPRRVDRMIRPFLVTPDMHLVHHSTELYEQQRNYGFALTLWDRMFRSYLAESAKGRDRQAIGVVDMQDGRPIHAGFSLKLPLT